MMLINSILLQRCPHCGEGRLFKSLLKMNQHCSECDLPLEREEGYYTGAMYMSYFLAIILLIPIWIVMIYRGVPFIWSLVVVFGLNVLLIPLLFRLSRSIWIHLDYGVDREKS